jgi:hypothetical protein
VEEVERQNVLPPIATVHHGFTNHSSDRHGNKVLVRPNFLGLAGHGGFVHLQVVKDVVQTNWVVVVVREDQLGLTADFCLFWLQG